MSEWDSIILSYDPLYWVQVGYDKGGIVGRRYFIEKQDYYGHSIKHFGNPSAGSWHEYKICHAQESGQWAGKYRFWIDGADMGYYNVTPCVPKDQQSFVETDTTSISIDGSHFQRISYFDGQTWRYWFHCVLRHDNPYQVDYVHEYEFTARGGG